VSLWSASLEPALSRVEEPDQFLWSVIRVTVIPAAVWLESLKLERLPALASFDQPHGLATAFAFFLWPLLFWHISAFQID
jgi:hypothetical protein